MTAPKPTKAELIQHVREEQGRVWGELHNELHYAVNRRWSIGSANKVDELLDILKLVPPTPWDHISYELVRGGIYEAVILAAGVEPKLPTGKQITETDLAMKRHFQVELSRMPEWYADTVTHIKEEFGPF